MSAQISMDKVIRAIIKGIEKAQRDYAAWSGGDWLWNAPEYLLTTYVARSIVSIKGPKLITIEHSTQSTMDDAGAITKGSIPKKIRPNGRVDLVLWRVNGSPRGIIELKNQVRSYAAIEKDVIRIDKMLHKNHASSKLQFGCVAFYASAKTDTKGGAEDKLYAALESIREDAVESVCDIIKVKLHVSTVRREEDSAWAAACLLLSKKKSK